jgi:hypothetical protein
MATTTTWVGGAVFAAVLVAAGGWTFGVSPQLDAADVAETDTVTVVEQNAKLQRDIVELKAQFENLDTYKADVAALEVQIPRTAELADYLREVATVTEASGAFVVSVKPGVPLSVSDAPAPAPAADAASEPAAGAEAPADTADATATAPVPSGVPAGFVAVPVDITLLGTVPQVATALASLQGSTARLFAVTSINGHGTEAKEASEGKPATNEGDLELIVSGFIYVVQVPDDAQAPAEDGAATPALPESALTTPLTSS